ncbi:hypothetical protein GNP82_16060 [Aliivibrio fischeri]|uniref:hypothetical protein n=1 Tax=Aliivibrio fischeri TaxID=668 RepID=UPI0012D97C4A|nr:hypothetical protein [Aliivibrio fischeri]MUJ19127.1 hypothetical protein [Aliivibrio fischeri]MUK39066.1 hypothetical protein [Aliivibrio fischeri]MUL07844.1 hypothetical protein [Aliivibrio fischeri]
MKKISALLLFTLISPPIFAKNTYSIKSLSNLKNVPQIGDTYKLDPIEQASTELFCWEKGENDDFSACQIVINYSEEALYDPCLQVKDRVSIPPIYVELSDNRFSGLHVSGMKIKFKEIKYGNLFFELIK